MTQLVQTISRVKKYINPDIKIDGILLTLVDSRTNLAKSTVEALRENFGNHIKMYRTSIPIGVKAAEASSKGKSIGALQQVFAFVFALLHIEAWIIGVIFGLFLLQTFLGIVLYKHFEKHF